MLALVSLCMKFCVELESLDVRNIWSEETGPIYPFGDGETIWPTFSEHYGSSLLAPIRILPYSQIRFMNRIWGILGTSDGFTCMLTALAPVECEFARLCIVVLKRSTRGS